MESETTTLYRCPECENIVTDEPVPCSIKVWDETWQIWAYRSVPLCAGCREAYGV